MVVEQNLALIRRLYDDVINGGNLTAAEAFFAPHYVRHDPDSPGLPLGPDGIRQLLATYRAAFPDMQVSLDDVVAAGDRVVVRWTSVGTHLGELMGHQPTGRRVSFGGISIYRIADGRIVEDWVVRDTEGLRAQMRAEPVRAGRQ